MVNNLKTNDTKGIYNLNENEFEKYTWDVVSKYFEQDKGRHIINHILASYNDFVFKKIDDIIEGFNPIQISNDYIPENDLYKYQINLVISNPQISKPIINSLCLIAKSATCNTFFGSCLMPHKISPETIPNSISANLNPEFIALITSRGDNRSFTE